MILDKYLVEEAKRKEKVFLLKQHHRRMAKATQRLFHHMIVKRDAMNKMISSWEKELRNVKRWDSDILLVMKLSLPFNLRDETKLVTRYLWILLREYITQVSGLYINLAMMRYCSERAYSNHIRKVLKGILKEDNSFPHKKELDSMQVRLNGSEFNKDILEARPIEKRI